LFAQINLIIIAVIGLLFCLFGYKYARFLTPLCGMIVVETALYLLMGEYLKHTEFTGALFYGVTAVASYVVLFFIMRLNGFFTGLLGSAALCFLVITATGIAGVRFVVPAAVTLSVLAALFGAVYKRAGVIAATTLFGAGASGGIILFLILARNAGYAAGLNAFSAVSSIIARNSMFFLAAYACLVMIGLLLQFIVTGRNQVQLKRIKITLESKGKMSV